MKMLNATIKGTIFDSGDGYRIYALANADRHRDALTLRNHALLTPGTRIDATGVWRPYKGKDTFVASRVEIKHQSGQQNHAAASANSGKADTALTPAAVTAWIKRSEIKGVGDASADKLGANLVAAFGRGSQFASAWQDLLNDPQSLAIIGNLPVKKCEAIAAAWNNDKTAATSAKLLDLGMMPSLTRKVVDQHQNDALAIVAQNPFALTDYKNIGFDRVDPIAAALGNAADDPRRIAAGLYKIIDMAGDQGHTGLPLTDAIKATSRLLDLKAEAIAEQVGKLAQQAPFETKDDFVQIDKMAKAEDTTATLIAKRLRLPPKPMTPRIEAALANAQARRKMQLDANQLAAAKLALTMPLGLIVGGPGVGKSASQNVIVAAAKALGERVTIMAPTGRAAKRISDLTGEQATTIHRGLEFSWKTGGFARNSYKPLDCDLLIIDEMSMTDLELFRDVMKAAAAGTRVILVGDADQLPSVGAGNVLADLLAIPEIARVRLTAVRRQAGQSGIISAAHAINAGEMPVASDDVEIITCEGDALLAASLNAVRKLTEEGYHADDILVLAAAKKGHAGTHALNAALKAAFNPGTEETTTLLDGIAWSLGDRVMQIVNDHDSGAMNGEIGTVIEVRRKQIKIDFGAYNVVYDSAKIRELVHAFATTTHKAQGSEAAAVVISLDSQAFTASRRLLYTALTRAKQKVVLIGSETALAKTIARQQDAKRHTRLSDKITFKLAQLQALQPDYGHGYKTTYAA